MALLENANKVECIAKNSVLTLKEKDKIERRMETCRFQDNTSAPNSISNCRHDKVAFGFAKSL
jgi:hypothetical protein